MKTYPIILSILILLLAQACEKKPEPTRISTTTPTSSKASPTSTRIDLGAAAVKRAEQEWAKTWIQQDDKWIVQDKSLPFLLQIKGRRSEVRATPLSEADRLNGIEWVGTVSFSSTALREFWLEASRDFDHIYVKGWNDWWPGDTICTLDVRKKNGEWVIASREPTIILEGLRREVMRPSLSPLPQ